MRNFFILFVFTLGLARNMSAQSASLENQTGFERSYKRLKQLVSKKEYQYTGSYVYDNRQREPLEAGRNAIRINNSQISGMVYSMPAMNKRIDLNGVIRNYEVIFNDPKQRINIAFKVDTPSAKDIDVFIRISANGNAFLTVSSDKNADIKWTGKLIEL
jgi:hypothetical protein